MHTELAVVKYGRTLRVARDKKVPRKAGKQPSMFSLVALNVQVNNVTVKRYVAENHTSGRICEATLISDLVDAINNASKNHISIQEIELQDIPSPEEPPVALKAYVKTVQSDENHKTKATKG